MSEYVSIDRIGQVVRTLSEQTGISVCIDCKIWFFNNESEPRIQWQLSFVNDKCKIRDFDTYQEVIDWIKDNAKLISGKLHPVLL